MIKIKSSDKIGILTFHNVWNHGACLQAYALQTKLFKLGIDNEFIDYTSPFFRKIYSDTRTSNRILKSIIKYPFLHGVRKSIKRAHEEFWDKYYVSSKEKYNSVSELEKANGLYSCFITGSDQVWNNNCCGFDEAYFLSFVNDTKKKNSYAASFGFDSIPEGFRDEYANRLAGFDNISVREKSGAEIINELLGRDAYVNLDPTLLLTQDDWEKVSIEPKTKKKYLLLYTIKKSDFIFDCAEKLQKGKNLEVIYIKNSLEVKSFNRDRFSPLKVCNPAEFLGLIKNAEYVLTNSFHGTVFSTIFKKQFLSEISGENKNGRAKNLLLKTGLIDRGLSSESLDKIDDEIKWDTVKEKLKAEQKIAEDYLCSLKNEKE